jgi:hypothetical protein
VTKRETCIDCRKLSPEAETDNTLISSRIGWRLTRSKGSDGTVAFEWRCPTCWTAHKRSRTEVSTAVVPSPPRPPPSSRRRGPSK